MRVEPMTFRLFPDALPLSYTDGINARFLSNQASQRHTQAALRRQARRMGVQSPSRSGWPQRTKRKELFRAQNEGRRVRPRFSSIVSLLLPFLFVASGQDAREACGVRPWVGLWFSHLVGARRRTALQACRPFLRMTFARLRTAAPILWIVLSSQINSRIETILMSWGRVGNIVRRELAHL